MVDDIAAERISTLDRKLECRSMPDWNSYIIIRHAQLGLESHKGFGGVHPGQACAGGSERNSGWGNDGSSDRGNQRDRLHFAGVIY